MARVFCKHAGGLVGYLFWVSRVLGLQVTCNCFYFARPLQGDCTGPRPLGSPVEIWRGSKQQCSLSVASTLFAVVAPHSHLWLDHITIHWTGPPDPDSLRPLIVAHGDSTYLWVTNSTFAGQGKVRGVHLKEGTRTFFGGTLLWELFRGFLGAFSGVFQKQLDEVGS